MTALMIKAISVPRMTRVTWYTHRPSVLGIPGLFMLAAALLFIDSMHTVRQRSLRERH